MDKVRFTINDLQQALATCQGKDANDPLVINNLVEVSRNSPYASGEFKSAEELRTAIRKASVFPEDSQLPEQIANAFDFVIRTKVISDSVIKAKITSEREQWRKRGFILDRNDFPICFQSLNQNPQLISAVLRIYTATALISPNLKILIDEAIEKLLSKNLIDETQIENVKKSLIELEENLQICSGADTKLTSSRDQLLTVIALDTLDSILKTGSNHLTKLIDDDLPADAPYLDLLSGYLASKFIQRFMSTEHKRQFLLVDKSYAVKGFYDIVDELYENTFSQRVNLIHKDFRDFDQGLEANSIGTIRMSNITSFLFNGENDIINIITNIFSRLDRLLMPKGKMIYCIRHKEGSTSQDINVMDLLHQTEKYNFSIFQEDSIDGSLVAKLIVDAINKDYEVTIGHCDQNGNFIEGKSGYFDKQKGPQVDTELILTKPKI